MVIPSGDFAGGSVSPVRDRSIVLLATPLWTPQILDTHNRQSLFPTLSCPRWWASRVIWLAAARNRQTMAWSSLQHYKSSSNNQMQLPFLRLTCTIVFFLCLWHWHLIFLPSQNSPQTPLGSQATSQEGTNWTETCLSSNGSHHWLLRKIFLSRHQLQLGYLHSTSFKLWTILFLVNMTGYSLLLNPK